MEKDQKKNQQKFQLNSKRKWELFNKRSEIIKKKQNLYSWLDFYKINLERPELERFKLVSEAEQYPNIRKVKQQLEKIDNELTQIEQELQK